MFRTQDLVISALPKEHAHALRLCIWGTRICIRPTIHCGFPTIHTCWRWTPITCWRWTPCNFATCQGFTCLQATCPGHSFVACRAGTLPDFGCPGGSALDPGDILGGIINPDTIVINDVADIRTLRSQLDDVMKQLDEIEESGLDAAVESPEDLEAMETHLKQALKEVQEKRKKGGKSK